MKIKINVFFSVFLLTLFTLSSTAQKNYAYSGGTNWVFFDIITEKDPSAFKTVSYITTKTVTMYDRDENNNKGGWIEPQSYIYKLTYDDNVTSEIRIRKKDFSSQEAQKLAQKYGFKMGQLPAVLRKGVKHINILKSDALFGGNNSMKSIEITIGETSKDYEIKGNLEETLVHESAHAALDYLYKDRNWITARDKDEMFISKYASDNPNREDIAESFLSFTGVNFRKPRISATDTKKVKENISNRLKFFERFNNDMYPVKVMENDPNAPAFNPKKYYRLTAQFTGEGKSLDIINDRDKNRLILSKTGNYSGQSWKIEAVGNGYYRLTTQFTGAGKSLDIINDRNKNRLIMGKTGNYSGQFWKIEPVGNGYYRLTTQFTGESKSLDIVNDSKKNQVIMGKTGNYSGQFWKITEMK